MYRLTLSLVEKLAIYGVLMEVCGAPAGSAERSFMHAFPGCGEFRFQGGLGFGGKVWAEGSRVYVTCYPEDETPERLAMIERADAAIAAIINR